MNDPTMPDRCPIRIAGLRRTVSDLARSVDFYCSALGFSPEGIDAPSAPGGARLRLGAQHIDLLAASDPERMPVAASAPDPRFQHAAIVTDDIDAAWRRLEMHAAVAISRGGPQTLPANTGGVSAFKFRDPDGHPLELIQFPPGIGDPRWQVERGEGPTLGIDHFALVVAAIDRSAAFFVRQLGFRLAGRSVNRGVEQDRLDGLDDVEVDVCSLLPPGQPHTPHLELLRYRHPTFAASSDASPAALVRNGDEIVCLGEQRSAVEPEAFHLRDPDGHRFVVDP